MMGLSVAETRPRRRRWKKKSGRNMIPLLLILEELQTYVVSARQADKEEHHMVNWISKKLLVVFLT